MSLPQLAPEKEGCVPAHFLALCSSVGCGNKSAGSCDTHLSAFPQRNKQTQEKGLQAWEAASEGWEAKRRFLCPPQSPSRP